MAETGRTKGVVRWLFRQGFRAPLVALAAALLIDLGPDGERRGSLFPVALRVLDPFVHACALDSVIFATLIALGSLMFGSALGALLGGRTFWGRPILTAVVIAPLAAAPAFLAVGVRGLSVWGLHEHSRGMLDVGTRAGVTSWALWIWTTLPAGIAWVALATARSYGALRPSWSDVARASGIGRFRAWWRLTRPMVRTSAFRAAALVFAVALVEPGAPLVLGLRRTLGFQIIRQLGEPHPFPGLAIWTAIALVIGALGSGALRAWGGRAILEAEPVGALRPASPTGALLSTVILAAWAVAAWVPAAGLVTLAMDRGPETTTARLISRLVDPAIVAVMMNSAMLGLGAAVVMLGLGVVAGRAIALPLGVSDRRLWCVPPLAVGVGVLAIGWLIAIFTRDSHLHASVVRRVSAAARVLDSYYRSAPALIVGVAWGLAALAGANPRSAGQSSKVSSALESARAAGFGRGRARRLAEPASWGRRLALLFAATALAATNVAPALLFTPWSDGRPLGPTVITLAGGTNADLADAALLAIVAVKINVLGLAALWFALRRRKM